MNISLIIFERKGSFIQSRKRKGKTRAFQVRCGLSGINEEKNVDTAVINTRVVVIGLSPRGSSGGG